jgi:putative restriction endonuclease
MSPDLPVRLAAFDWLSRQVELHGDVLPWAVLHRGFDYPPERGAAGQRVPLVSQQGIFKPRLLALPLSIRTAVDGPYDDALGHVLHYRYRGTDPFHRDNVGLREAMRQHVPLVYLHGLEPGRYLVTWPVYVVGDDPAGLTFTVQLDSAAYPLPEAADFDLGEPRREYVTVTFRRRLHQRAFRERVLSAYRVRCAMCRLRHRELLDAAHIVADRDPAGAPRVSNGLSLCKLHHAAFDSLFVTVDPDYRIVVRRDVLEEEDGPMLRHGLQELHGVRIGLPRRGEWLPSREGLEERLGRFRRAG